MRTFSARSKLPSKHIENLFRCGPQRRFIMAASFHPQRSLPVAWLNCLPSLRSSHFFSYQPLRLRTSTITLQSQTTSAHSSKNSHSFMSNRLLALHKLLSNMPVVTVRFLGLVALSAVILLSIPNIRTIIRIAHYLTRSSETPADIASKSYTTSEGEEQLIPKIIHQIYYSREDPSNETTSTGWDDVRHACNTTNPELEYRLWTTNSSHQFIEKHYKWFLETYDSYGCPDQRVSTLRYFVKRHYGGIYIGPNYNCARGLEPLLFYPAWILDHGHGITGARPNHPYWIMMTESLAPPGHDSLSPHSRITHHGGPGFEEAIWDKYHAKLPTNPGKEDRIYRIMIGPRGGVFFKPNGGLRHYGLGYPASKKGLACLLLFAMFIISLARSWRAIKTHQREYQKLIPAKDAVGGYGGI